MINYPIYVISKGRHDCCLTAKFLIKDGVDFSIVVEPQEYDLYRVSFPNAKILILPFSNLGLGGIPARNWCWEDSIKKGFKKHFILDDNIDGMYARAKGQRLNCESTPAFIAVERFSDRYENLAIAGLNYGMFATETSKMPPFVLNCHVYSFLLIRNEIPYRWRGRYNEDTDLCLQVLSGGYCTALINVFLIKKKPTMVMKGGNSAELYKGDGRLKMSRSLERVWPRVVETKRKFKRPQHHIKFTWGKFDTQLIPDKNHVRPTEAIKLDIEMVKDRIKSQDIQKIFDDIKKESKDSEGK